MVSCSVATAAQAQAPDAVNQYARPGYATKTVYVWGAVSAPGVWRVEENTDLLELLTVARMTDVGTSKRRILRVYREAGGRREEIYRERMDEILGAGRDYPELQNGDILLVETKDRLSFQAILAPIGALSALVLLAIRLGDRL